MSAAIAESPVEVGIFNYPECTFAPTGLIIPPGMKFERWETLGGALRTAAKGVQFWIGDWIRYGEHEYGEKYAQAIETTGKANQTLRNYVFVAESIDLSRRRDNVDFSTHAEVAGLPIAEQERILHAAELEELKTRRDVRREARRVKRRLNQLPDQVDQIHTPEVQAFLSDYVNALKAIDNCVPDGAAFLRSMIQSHIGQVQWQKDRSIEDDCNAIFEAVEETLGTDDDVYSWLIQRGYFMSDPDLEQRLELMIEQGRIYKVKQGGKKETQRGDRPFLYHPAGEITGEM